MAKTDVYEIITNDIIERIENSGRLPWHKPWDARYGNAALPMNAATGRAYSGINVLILWSLGHEDMRYATYKQAQSAGGSVVKGSKGIRVVYWNMVEKKDKATGEVDIVPMLRYYTVFNVSDIEGAEWKTTPPETTESVAEVEGEHGYAVTTADLLYRHMPQRPTMTYDGGDKAYYMPATDRIHMPCVDAFHTGEGYAETLLHEMVHSTGHESRLDRHMEEGCVAAQFGSESYSREELVAEIGSAFLMAHAGIDNDNSRRNNAAYVKSWLAALKADSKAIIYAAARAQKAATYILTDEGG